MVKPERYWVEFPQEGSVVVEENQSLLEASLLAGIPLFHACGGNARCSTCRVLVLEGQEKLSPPNEKEKALSSQLHFPPNVRLACQTSVKGKSVKVARIIRDETDIDLYVGPDAGTFTRQIGEEKELVLFFLDIRNFTAFVESQLAFDVIHIIRKLFTTFQRCIEKNNGRIIETTGDGIYAVFGLNGTIHASAANAVAAGFAILEALETLNDTYFNKYFFQSVSIGIGIHEGMAVAGSIQLDHEEHLIIMGYPVNIAARLQNATKELNNSFLISAAVFDLLPAGQVPAAATAMVQLRGVATPVLVYLLGKPYTSQTMVL